MLIEVEVVDTKDPNFNQVRIGGTVVLVKAEDLVLAQPTLPTPEPVSPDRRWSRPGRAMPTPEPAPTSETAPGAAPQDPTF